MFPACAFHIPPACGCPLGIFTACAFHIPPACGCTDASAAASCAGASACTCASAAASCVGASACTCASAAASCVGASACADASAAASCAGASACTCASIPCSSISAEAAAFTGCTGCSLTPQFVQNTLLSAICAPQLLQSMILPPYRRQIRCPHTGQNALSAGICEPH